MGDNGGNSNDDGSNGSLLHLLGNICLGKALLNSLLNKGLDNSGIIGAARRSCLELPKLGQLLRRGRERINGSTACIGEFAIMCRCQGNGMHIHLLHLMDGRNADGTVRAEHVLVLIIVLLDHLESHCGIGTGRRKVLLGLFQKLTTDGELARRLEILHPFCQCGGIIASEVEQVSLKVTGNADIHRWADRLVDIVPVILTLGEESVEDIVLIGRNNQPANGKAHLLGVKPGKDVAEVASGDGKVDRLDEGVLVRNAQVGPEIVRGLRQDTAPVDRVDGTKVDALPELLVVEGGLDDVLTIVKGTVDGDAVDVGVGDGGHLSLLDLTDAAVGVEDDTVHTLLATEAVNGSRTGIAGRGAKDGEPSTVGASLKEVFKEVAQHLKSNVLEGKRRSMEKLLTTPPTEQQNTCMYHFTSISARF